MYARVTAHSEVDLGPPLRNRHYFGIADDSSGTSSFASDSATSHLAAWDTWVLDLLAIYGMTLILATIWPSFGSQLRDARAQLLISVSWGIV